MPFVAKIENEFLATWKAQLDDQFVEHCGCKCGGEENIGLLAIRSGLVHVVEDPPEIISPRQHAVRLVDNRPNEVFEPQIKSEKRGCLNIISGEMIIARTSLFASRCRELSYMPLYKDI